MQVCTNQRSGYAGKATCYLMAGQNYGFRPIVARPPLALKKALAGAILSASYAHLKNVERYLEQSYRFWKKKNIPRWQHQVGYKFGDIYARIWTDSEPYVFVDEGTRVRHAVMHRDFISKSKPNRRYSTMGRHPNPVFISRRVNLKGIEPRNFTKNAAKDTQDDYVALIDAAIAKQVERFGKG